MRTVGIVLLLTGWAAATSSAQSTVGTVKSHTSIDGNFALVGSLSHGDDFGGAIADLGDLDGDGIADLAVGAPQDDEGPLESGCVWILFLAADGSVRDSRQIYAGVAGFTGTLENFDGFGWSVAALGDLDGDGVEDLAVGAPGDGDGPTSQYSQNGAVWILHLRTDGTVKAYQKISGEQGGFTGVLDDDFFGSALAILGDMNGDGVTELAVGAESNGDGGAHGSALGAVWILYLNRDGTVLGNRKISATAGGFSGPLAEGDRFGYSVAALGDRDGDGISELAVGAPGDDDGVHPQVYLSAGAVWVLFLSADGTVKTHQKISAASHGLHGLLDQGDAFGYSLATPGDLDGDGLTDLAAGAAGDGSTFYANGIGAVWILFLAADGSLQAYQKIANREGGLPAVLQSYDLFGSALAVVQDFGGNGVPDLAVGATGDDGDGMSCAHPGGIWMLDLDADGVAASHDKIGANEGGMPSPQSPGDYDGFARSVAVIGDLDGNGVEDLAAGAPESHGGSPCDVFERGAVLIFFMEPDGSVLDYQEISATKGGFTGQLDTHDQFGYALAGLGDVDGDAVEDLAVGAWLDDDGGLDQGAVWILFLEPDGGVKAHQKISETEGGFSGQLDKSDVFGSSVARLGDLDGDGVAELAVGAPGDDDGSSSSLTSRGAVWVLFLRPDGTVKAQQKISDTQGGFTGTIKNNEEFGESVTGTDDIDGDGVPDLCVGAPSDEIGGALWILFLEPDGSVKAHQKIGDGEGGFTALGGDFLGRSVSGLKDIDGNGVPDLVAGANGSDDGGQHHGAVWILMLDADGTVKAQQKISSTAGGFTGTLVETSNFGWAVSAFSDLDLDGVQDLAVGTYKSPGIVWLMDLNGSPWGWLGSGLAGAAGIPRLVGNGTLLADSPGSLELSAAAPDAPAALFIASASAPAPFKGGVLLASPPVFSMPLLTDGQGGLSLQFVWPSGVPSGAEIYFQTAVQDRAAIHGTSLSNGILATTP